MDGTGSGGRPTRRGALVGVAAALGWAWGGAAMAQGEPGRVAAARRRREEAVRALFTARSLPYPPAGIFVRIFKHEGVVELWGRKAGVAEHVLVKTFPVCAPSGTLGPKRRQGDLQVPEGFYSVSVLNPWSSYHLSLGLDYPNASDRVLSDRKHPGGDIFIHGDCVTIGCVPLGDDGIEELYLAVLDARAAGQRKVPVHLFPTRFDAAGLRAMRAVAAEGDPLWRFWADLRVGHDAFESTRRVPRVTVSPEGRYGVTPG
ncbi:L,D-transpeptidase family protein [Myxococcota bacterium]|nr:L,D-transpeptidase family protein [Myxococcota bacterium]